MAKKMIRNSTSDNSHFSILLDKRYIPFLLIVWFVLLNAFFNSMASAYGAEHFPFDTFLYLPEDLHGDLIKMAISYFPADLHIDTAYWQPLYRHYYQLHTDGWFQKQHFDNAHMLPISYMVGWVASVILQYTSPMVLLMVFYLVVFLSILSIAFVFNNTTTDIYIITLGMIISYPLLFLITRGHIFSLISSVSIIYFVYILLMRRTYLWVSVLLFALIVNLRPNAMVLGLLFFVLHYKSAFRYAFMSVVLSILLFVTTLYASHVIDMHYSFASFVSGLSNYMHQYVTGYLGVLFNNSLYGAFRRLLIAWKISLDSSVLLIVNQFIVGLGLLALVISLYKKIKRSLSDYEFAFVVLSIYILMSTVIGVYHLLPFFVFLLIPFRESDTGLLSARYMKLIMVASVFMLVPKNYIFIDFYYKNFLSIETLINPLVLLVSVLVVLNAIVDNSPQKGLLRIDTFYMTQRQLFWMGILVIIIYLIPLLRQPLYISIFDILDSTIPQLKILAHSGQMFASNTAIIPNMMGGLPRSVYGSEFNVLLWLNYFFDPMTVYIFNQVAIHIVAYLSMYLFLKRYVVPERMPYTGLLLVAGSLYFGLLPFFSPEGLTIPLIPLVTYSLLNIQRQRDTRWDWALLVLMPLYTDFVFFYMFYIVMAGVYIAWDTLRHKHLNRRLFLAVFLMGVLFLLKEYRLVINTFISPEFVSHRVEFNKFFVEKFLESYRRAHSLLLNGHLQHSLELQMPYLLPMILIGMLLSLSVRKFTKQESMVIWLIIVTSFVVGIWDSALTQLYTMPILLMYSLVVWLLSKDGRGLSLWLIAQLMLSVYMLLAYCECGHFVVEHIRFFKTFNISRLTFIQPFMWGVMLVLAMKIYMRKLRYTYAFVVLFMMVQVFHQFGTKEFYNIKKNLYSTFEQYYEPELFAKIKKDISKPFAKKHFISFGFEPAVPLYSGFYTVDGYITNYPLSYKHKFRKVVAKIVNTMDKDNNFDEWGSKLYLMGVVNLPDYYKKNIDVLVRLPFSPAALCDIGTDYLLSAYKIDDKLQDHLKFISQHKGDKDSWDVYLYEIVCH